MIIQAGTRAKTIEDREWVTTRCRACSAMLFKIERNALRTSKVIEVKCGKCNALNYSVGDGDEVAA